MAYVIAEPCIDTKDNSCVEVCPVDCIHPTPDEPDACFAEDQLPDEWQQFIQINADYFKQAG
jgi:ferredoxin